jgi:hypothetical protein
MQIWSTNTEQRFAMRSWGDSSRQLVEFEGVWLVRKPPKNDPPATRRTQAEDDMLKEMGFI